jgi:hypothetical protein
MMLRDKESVEKYIDELQQTNVFVQESKLCQWCNKIVNFSCKTVKDYNNCENLKQ